MTKTLIHIDRERRMSGRGGFPSSWFVFVATATLPDGTRVATGACKTRESATQAIVRKLHKLGVEVSS